MDKIIWLSIYISFSIFSLGISCHTTLAQPVPPPPPPPNPPNPLPDPLPLPPPQAPPNPIEDFRHLVYPWTVDLGYERQSGFGYLELGRDCNCKGFRFNLQVKVLGGVDEKTFRANINGAALGITIPFRLSQDISPLLQNNNLDGSNYIASLTVPYVIGSIEDSTSIIFGDLSFDQSPGFEPLAKLSAFDPDNNGIYTFQNAQAFSQFLDSSLTCVPEPTTTLGLLALGTLGAASTLKRKQK